VRGGRETGHVDADLGDDDLSGAPTDPRDRLQLASRFSEGASRRSTSSSIESISTLSSSMWRRCMPAIKA
jgi:hypothetical protein